MRYSRIYLDSNIFIRAFESAKDDDVAADLLRMFGAAAGSVSAPFATSHITLAETLVVPVRDNVTLNIARYERLLSASSPWLQVVPVSRQILIAAAHLRAKSRLKLPDAIHMASAASAEVSHFLSRDTDFTKPALAGTGITAINPNSEELAHITAWLAP